MIRRQKELEQEARSGHAAAAEVEEARSEAAQARTALGEVCTTLVVCGYSAWPLCPTRHRSPWTRPKHRQKAESTPCQQVSSLACSCDQARMSGRAVHAHGKEAP